MNQKNRKSTIGSFRIITLLQEYMSAFYGPRPPDDNDAPIDGSLFRETYTSDHIPDSDVKVIKHHINQENASWYTKDQNKNKGIEISPRTARKIDNLIPYAIRYW